MLVLWFILTLAFIRGGGALLRRRFPQAEEAAIEETFLRQAAPTFVVAALITLLAGLFQISWISTAGTWFSIGIDALYLLLLLLFKCHERFEMFRLRRSPESVNVVIICGRFGSLKFFRLLTALLPGANFPMEISPTTVRTYLGGDLRYIDIVAESEDLETDIAELNIIPHLPLWQAEVEPVDGTDALARPFVYNISQLPKLMYASRQNHLVNRSLNFNLSSDLWETSCNLCRHSPKMISASWKSFHFQESLRLRLVTLFNSAELLLRLVGSMILSRIRDRGSMPHETPTGERLYPPGSIKQWNTTLRWLLSSEDTRVADLDPWCRVLLAKRDDFDLMLEVIAPFVQLVNLHPDQIKRDTLAAWSILMELRNKTLGHGAVGWHLALNPQPYVSALHRFFLMLVQDVVQYELGVLAVRGYPTGKVIGYDQGIDASEVPPGDCLAMALWPEPEEFVVLEPYVKFESGRLIVLNRITRGEPEYVAYHSSSIAEPSYLTLPVAISSFLEPCYDLPVTLDIQA